MADLGLQQAEEDFELKQQQRTAAAEYLKKIREEAHQGFSNLEEAASRSRKTLGAQSAAAVAATLGQVGSRPSGGGQLAALRQSALSRGVAQSNLDLQQAQELAAARLQVAEKDFETSAAERALGTLSDDRQKKFAQVEQNIQNLIAQYLSGTLGVGNNVYDFRRSAYALLAGEGDPVVRDYIAKRINQISASNDNFNFLNFTLYPLTGNEGAGAGL